MRPTLKELEQRCQKPDHQVIGSWMARRIARPGALRITWLIAPHGVSANAATLVAWFFGLVAAAGFATGSPAAWLGGAVCLQLWYLLDHVDGQLARWHGTASLDGVQLDYLMHHSLNLLLPIALGYGTSRAHSSDIWLGAGLAWGVAALLNGLLYDARYKAFMQRLKRVRGELIVRGGGGGRPAPQPAPPRRPRRWMAWALQKSTEPPVTMNVITLFAVAACAAPHAFAGVGACLVTLMSAANVVTTTARLWKSQRYHQSEQEFAAWYATPPGRTLWFEDGWWYVAAEKAAAGTRPAGTAMTPQPREE